MKLLSMFGRVGLMAFGISTVASSALHAQKKSTLEVLPGARKNSVGLGKFPPGWMVRPDTTLARSPGDTTTLTIAPVGWNVRTGPSSVIWSPARNTAHGSFVIAGLLYLAPPRTRALPAYGVFFGGKELGTPKARYTEFLLRNDSKFSVRQHDGAKVTVIKDWTQLAGITLQDGRYDELAGNRMRVIADEQLVQFVVNRAVAFSMLRSSVAADGIFGVRVGTDQDVTVETLEVEKVGASQEVPKFKLAPKASDKGKGVPKPPRQG